MTSTIRAFVSDDFLFSGGGVIIRVAVQEINDQGWATRTHQILENTEDGFRFRLRTDDERAGMVVAENDTRTSIRLPEGVGEVLLEALARHFHGSASAQDLRADLAHERTRRDLLEDRAHELAVRAAETAYSVETALRLAVVTPSVGGGGGYGGQGGTSGGSGSGSYGT